MTAKTYKQPKRLLICEGIFVDYIDRNATQAWKVYKESWNAGHEKQKNRKTRGEAEREDVIREAPELQKEAAERLGGQHVQTEQDGALGSRGRHARSRLFFCRVWVGVWHFLLQCLLNTPAG